MKFLIKTLGCKVNQVESAFIMEQLTNKGFKHAEGEETADILILNSCAVTERAYKETLKILRNWEAKRPKAIIVTGCSAQIYGEKLKEFAKHLEVENFFILGHEQKFSLENYLRGITDKEDNKFIETISKFDKCFPFLIKEFYGHSRAFVKIQDGCSNFCSYCIVPYARGPSRSIPEEHVIKQIEIFLKQGYEEIVLTGIHLGAYGADFKPPKKLVHLLFHIEELFSKLGKPLNLRLSSLEVNEIDDDFISFAKESKYLCHHFHIPLQSGSNKILKMMNRKYISEEYLEKVNLLASLFPKATFGADVIVGFPGEGEKEFRETYEVIEKSPLNWLHLFPFSPRPGTVAEKLEPKISEKVIKERIKLLKELFETKRKKFLEKNIGEERRTILEEEVGEMFKGLTDNYIFVYFKKEEGFPFRKGKLVYAKLLELRNGLVLAEASKEN
ncbi:MAG: tRNA (N(6)-L-threonylcarbamoyladenosine(37)-C(2))-methylthiotransferase MtaB [Caldimicrobium sp.]